MGSCASLDSSTHAGSTTSPSHPHHHHHQHNANSTVKKPHTKPSSQHTDDGKIVANETTTTPTAQSMSVDEEDHELPRLHSAQTAESGETTATRVGQNRSVSSGGFTVCEDNDAPGTAARSEQQQQQQQQQQRDDDEAHHATSTSVRTPLPSMDNPPIEEDARTAAAAANNNNNGKPPSAAAGRPTRARGGSTSLVIEGGVAAAGGGGADSSSSSTRAVLHRRSLVGVNFSSVAERGTATAESGSNSSGLVHGGEERRTSKPFEGSFISEGHKNVSAPVAGGGSSSVVDEQSSSSITTDPSPFAIKAGGGSGHQQQQLQHLSFSVGGDNPHLSSGALFAVAGSSSSTGPAMSSHHRSSFESQGTMPSSNHSLMPPSVASTQMGFPTEREGNGGAGGIGGGSTRWMSGGSLPRGDDTTESATDESSSPGGTAAHIPSFVRFNQ